MVIWKLYSFLFVPHKAHRLYKNYGNSKTLLCMLFEQIVANSRLRDNRDMEQKFCHQALRP